MNKWIMLALNVLVMVVGYLATVNWNTYLPSDAGSIVMALGAIKAVLAAIMPPASQSTITSTGGTIVTHT